MTKKKCLVIGYGSIGKRHVNILMELGHQVSIVSKQLIEDNRFYSTIEEAIQDNYPDYIVIANETSEHEKTISKLNGLGYTNKILVEKPLFSDYIQNEYNSIAIFVGYNLRFHPIIQKLAIELVGKNIISVQSYVGQYLPTWRPGTDYRKSYSANKSMGGGVLRDLSHELDYLQFLFGEWKEMSAYGGHFSNLELDTDDHFTLTYKTEKVPVINLHMNYLDHLTQRFIIINTNKDTYKADFTTNTLQKSDELFHFENERGDTYRKQHIAVLDGDTENLCSFQNGYEILKMIKEAERASREKVWVYNE